jgi:L-2-hydroxycarboxylate dehydrogenase (NAD+)
MNENIIWTDFATLESFMRDVFIKSGVSEENAGICAEVLITADKRGIDSHGIARLKSIYYDRIKEGILIPNAKSEIIKETYTTAVINAHHGMGHSVSKKAMQLAIDKAKKYGMGMTVVKNSTHYGIAGYYVMQAAENDMIGITGTNARPSVAPTFGVENMLGTNPLTFGLPTDEEFSFVLDCATSLSQRGKIEVYSRKNLDLPDGWVIGQEGKSRSDTHQVLEDLVSGKAALTPLGGIGEEGAGYKGYGYSTVVEIMSAALQAGNFLKALNGFDNAGNKTHYGLGHFFIAINIEAFIEPENFKKTTGEILRDLRNSKKMPGQSRIFTAGEKEYLAYLERKDKGAPLNKQTQKEIKQITDELNLTDYKWQF